MSRILFLSMYPLSFLDSAPKVRSYFLYKELNKLERTDLIEGTRFSRSWKIVSWILSGNVFKNRSIYVESSSTMGSPVELLFLTFARLFNKKVIVFIRDAYPLFPKEFPADKLKKKILYFGWKVSIVIYRMVSNKLAFPTQPLADLFSLSRNQVFLLPPGGNAHSVDVNVLGSNKVGYVGGFTPRYGSRIFTDAISKLRKNLPTSLGVVVTRKLELSTAESHNEKIEFRESTSQSLIKVLEDVDICVIPLPATQYNKMTLPVKVFDYLSLGKAVVTTNLPEVVKIIESEEVGLVCNDNPADLAITLSALLNNKVRVKNFKENALRAIKDRHSWTSRAKDLHEILTDD